MSCMNCGLLDQQVSPAYCLRFKKAIKGTDEGEDCIYYQKVILEDGEILTPQQHLLIQDQDFRSKKMQGPIR